MEELVKIEEITLTTGDFITSLRFMNKFDALLDDVVKSKLVAIAARRGGITVSEEEIQERADQLRRVLQLHRASEMMAYLEANHATVEDFEAFVIEMLLNEKQEIAVTAGNAVEEYFKLNSPKFEMVEVSNIALTNEGAAREIMSILEDDPDEFTNLATEHSIAENGAKGGKMGRISRGSVAPEVEAKIFNSELNTPIGPHELDGGAGFEIFMVTARHPATLDTETRREIERLLFADWMDAKAKEFSIEVL